MINNMLKKPFYVIIILAILMSGCKTQGKTANSANKTATTQSTSAGQTQTTSSTVSGGIGSIATVGQIPVSTVGTGSPIKAAQVLLNNGTLYYISPVNSNICAVNENAAVQNSGKKTASNTNNSAAAQLGGESASEMLYFNNAIYYSNKADGNKLYSIGIDGKNKKLLTNKSAYNIVMIGTNIYYIDVNGDLSIFDTSNNDNSSLGVKTHCFDSDGTNVYYEAVKSDTNNTFNSIKLDGTGDTILNNDSPTSIVVQDGKVFYGNGKQSQSLFSTTLDGSNIIKFNDAKAANLQYDNGWIYYINTADFRNIYKVQPDGSQNTKVIDDPFIQSYVVSNGSIYYTRSIDLKDIIYKTAG